jgi:hypothetical protein
VRDHYPTNPLDADAEEPLTFDEVTMLAFCGMVAFAIFCLLTWAAWQGGQDLYVLL